MRYTSTRADLDAAFVDVVSSALAPAGGLYLPQKWPRLRPDDLARLCGRG